MRWLSILPLLLPAAALAGAGDVAPSHLSGTDADQAWRTLVRELGTAVANQPTAPPHTLGSYGFDISTNTTFAFIQSQDDGRSAWERAHPDASPGTHLFIPQLSARKGLPMSFEVGGAAGWVGMSRSGTFSAFGRLALAENYKPIPDVTLQVGYAGYIGNDELDLGVMDMGLRVGSSWTFGWFPGIRNAIVSPWADFSLLRVAASPTFDPDRAGALGIERLSPRRGSDHHATGLVLPRLGGGLQIANGNVLYRVVGTWAPGTIATATVGMGFTY